MTTHIKPRLHNFKLWTVAIIFSTGCATSTPPALSSVTGTATYRERMLLPPESVFEATLEEVSRADAPSEVIGNARVTSPKVPISFSINYDPARIHAGRRYVVRAWINLNGHLIYTTDTTYPVLGENPNHVDLVLIRVKSGKAADTSSRMRGIYSYMADAATFVDCADGRRMSVAEEGDNAALQAAYTAARTGPGAEHLVTVDAHIAMRPMAEGGSVSRPVLWVDRYIGFSTKQNCDSTASEAELVNTYWKLLTIKGKPIEVGGRQREPHIILQADKQRVVGFGGCNRLMGSYTLEGDRLKFGRTASTMMACPQGMELERAFHETLQAVVQWRIHGQRMELLDIHGNVLAEFESRYLK